MNAFDRLTLALASAIRLMYRRFWSIPEYVFDFLRRSKKRSIQNDGRYHNGFFMAPTNQPETENWREIYASAVLETNFERLPGHILLAQAAIQQRLAGHVALDAAERLAIRDALRGISALRQSMTAEKSDERITQGATSKADQTVQQIDARWAGDEVPGKS